MNIICCFFSQVDKKVKLVIGHGAYSMVYPKYPRRDLDDVLDALRNGIGDKVDIYSRDEIPEHLHWCTDNSKYCPPILVLARPGVVRLSVKSKFSARNCGMDHRGMSVV